MAHLLTSPLDPARSWLDLPGLLTFAKKDDGSGDDDEFDIDDDADDDADDDDNDDADKSSKKDDDDDADGDDDEPLSDKAKGILRKNRKEARAAKARAAKAERELADLKKGKGKGEGGDDDQKITEAEARGASRGEKVAIAASVRGALMAAGLVTGDDSPKAIKRAMRLIDVEGLSIDDDGEVDGLDDAIADLKEEMPALFRRPKKARGNINGTDSRDGKGGPKKPLTATERQAAALKR